MKISALVLVLTLPGVAMGQVSFEFIGSFYATDLSADGSVLAGNSVELYETCRWTAAGGLVLLGNPTYPYIGTGAGVPEVSADGTKISATIIGEDLSYGTPGLWTLGVGWQECMPRTPSDGGLLDAYYGSGWGISGDGNALVGLYWRPNQTGGSAHPCRWTQATGVIDLGTLGGGSCDTCGSGRANGANRDGSVIVGWIENPDNGAWWPTVWVNGVRTVLKQTEGFADAESVTPDGTIVVGSSWFPPITSASLEEAAVWRWNGSQWVEQRIGKLFGTAPPFGMATASSVSADGKVIVGYNRFGAGNETGFIWQQSTGMVDVVNYLTSNGVTLPANFDFQNLTAISDDGSVIAGIGQYTVSPYETQSFLIHRCALRGDMNKDGVVDGDDIAGFIRAKLGQNPEAGENVICANYSGTLEQDVAAFTADLLSH